MHSEKTRLALSDIRHNIFVARRFLDGLTLEDFKRSDLHVYAVTRALEIVSEASRRLPASFRQRHAHLPWKQIMGVGNVLRHNYDDVVETILWDTARDSFTPLLQVVLSEISAFEGEG